MFGSLLIANRGEIACRVIRTARRMGLRTVAVYSDADAGALHVAQADSAVRIGPAPARESYLDIDAVVAAAVQARAEAVHPGYGFLAENPAFAEACAEAGLVFVGPSPETIRAMGDKAAAKALFAAAGVPVVPGYHGDDQDDGRLEKEAAGIGFPLVVKATAGGGGRGMRVIAEPAEFHDGLNSARREAAAAFGDDRVMLERFIAEPRHIEVQVFGDRHGRLVHLFERDCTLQRRHQKVVEEAPSPQLDEKTRRAMARAAVTAARTVGYVGAGTVEFIAAPMGAFHFLEMNTRLQVEHPVTELITGTDMVEWQLRIAAGEPLPASQREIRRRGHAIEARIYAEDPARDFLPAPGRITHLRPPPTSRTLRFDTGVKAGDEVGTHYDPLLAKLVVCAEDRKAALDRMARALEELDLAGVVTNQRFLAALVRHPEVAANRIDTGFIERRLGELLPCPPAADATTVALVALGVLALRAERTRDAARRSADPHSPWSHVDGWRLADFVPQALTLRDGSQEVTVTGRWRGDLWELQLPHGTVRAKARLGPEGELEAEIEGRRRNACFLEQGPGRFLLMRQGGRAEFVVPDPHSLDAGGEAAGGGLRAPMPGRIVKTLVAEGDSVAAGQALVVLEAMKMEHTIRAPAEGRVVQLNCASGDQVEEGLELLRLADTAGE
ncbi:MAG: acetyl/propionyl/methylcrotonyl-CoA carboxylase subunit alpha [Alphaproteobacteria bacterium]